MDGHKHKFERLSDEAIFCGCGEIKLASGEKVCTLPHGYPITVYPVPCTRPHYPSWQPTIYWGTTTGDVTTGGTFTPSDTFQIT